jgi:hypothetical protein
MPWKLGESIILVTILVYLSLAYPKGGGGTTRAPVFGNEKSTEKIAE